MSISVIDSASLSLSPSSSTLLSLQSKRGGGHLIALPYSYESPSILRQRRRRCCCCYYTLVAARATERDLQRGLR